VTRSSVCQPECFPEKGVVETVAQACCHGSRPDPFGSPIGRRLSDTAHDPCSPYHRRQRYRPSPATICWAAVTIAWAPEPQTRLTVIAGDGHWNTSLDGGPAAQDSSCCRAWMTLPMMTLPTAPAIEPGALQGFPHNHPRQARWQGPSLSDPL